MIRTLLIPLFASLATQAAAHTEVVPHVHGSNALSVPVVMTMCFVLVTFTIGAAAMIWTRSKGYPAKGFMAK